MSDENKKKAEELVKYLKPLGLNHGVIIKDRAVILVGPGAPITYSPLVSYSLEDVEEAEKLKLLKKTTWTMHSSSGSWPFDVFVVA